MKKIIYLLLIATLYGQQTTDENIQNISIVSTSNVFSEFYDCGCPKNPLGGIARKTFFLNNMMSGRESILIDAGNLFFDSNKINYRIIFNGSPSRFLELSKKNNLKINTDQQIWQLN